MSAITFQWLAAKSLQVMGLASVFHVFYRLSSTVTTWLLPPAQLTRYQRKPRSWALVTGASAGIGLGCAQELAVRGFNVVLHGHKSEELREARTQIEREIPDAAVKILVIDATKVSPSELEKTVREIADLQLTLLVNNVGGLFVLPQLPRFRRLDEYSAEEIDGTTFLNARFMAQLTRLMIPILDRNGPSLILTMSSGAKMGMPGVAIYSACKAFVYSLSHAVPKEMNADNMSVDALALVIRDVKSQAKTIGLQPLSPDQREFARAAINWMEGALSRKMPALCPWPFHVIQLWIFDAVPEWLSSRLISDLFERKSSLFKAGKED